MNRLHALLWCALLTVPVTGQPADWTRLQEITPGQRVSALRQDGKYIQGRFTAWTAEAIEISVGRKPAWIKPVEVKRLWVEQKTSRWRAVLIGAAVGFGVAFPIGAASAGYLSDQNNPRFQTRAGFGAGFGLFGAGIGAGIGALAGGSKNVLAYRGDKR